jgi:hypothetical protein
VNPYVEAGVRVIFKRSLMHFGLKVKADIPTDELVRMAVEWEAPVIHESRRWLTVGMGKPGLADPERDLMKEQAVNARYLWTKEIMEKRSRS